MALYDSLTGANVDPEGYAGPMNKLDEVLNTSRQMTEADFFSDPNNLRLMAAIGSRISQGQTAGQAIGEPTQQMIRSKAAQQAGGNLMQQIVQALQADPTGKSLLGPKEDMNTLDSIHMTDSGLTIKAPNASQTQPFSIGAEKPLEAIKSFQAPEVPEVRTPATRQDLRDFFQSPVGLTAQDLRGLDPEDVGRLVNQALGTAQFREGITQETLARKEREDIREQQRIMEEAKIRQAAEAAKTKRVQELEDIATKQKGRIELEQEKARLRGDKPGLTEYQTQQLDLNRQRIDATKAKEEAAQQRDVISYETKIMEDPGSPASAPIMDYINTTQNKPYYYIQYDIGGDDFIPFNERTVGERVPLVDKKGRKLTMDIVRKAAKKIGVTPEEFLANPNIGILKQVDGLYYPVAAD